MKNLSSWLMWFPIEGDREDSLIAEVKFKFACSTHDNSYCMLSSATSRIGDPLVRGETEVAQLGGSNTDDANHRLAPVAGRLAHYDSGIGSQPSQSPSCSNELFCPKSAAFDAA